MNSTTNTTNVLPIISTMLMQTSKLDETSIKLSTGKNTSLSYQNPTDNTKVAKLLSDVKSYTSLVSNLNDKYTMLMVADKGIENQQTQILKIKSLVEQSNNSELTVGKKAEMTREVQLLVQDFDKIANQTLYGDIQLLGGNLKNAKLNTQINGYQSIDLELPSSDTSAIVNARFETGEDIKKSQVLSLEFGLSENKTFKLPSVIISHGSSTGIGKLAQVINDNQDILGFRASFNVSTSSKNPMSAGLLKNFRINDEQIGTISLTGAESYINLINKINDKTNTTGVVASLSDKKLLLQSESGRGIVVGAESGIGILNLGDGDDVNYGRLTLVNSDGLASNILNEEDIGFTRIESKKIAFDKLASGNLDADEKKAIGIKDKDLQVSSRLDLNNDVFRNTLLGVIEKVSSLLQNTKKHIAYVQEKIQDSKNIASSDKISTNINISNIDDIDYATEILNNAKYKTLRDGAAYIFAKSLSFNSKIQNILFSSLKD